MKFSDDIKEACYLAGKQQKYRLKKHPNTPQALLPTDLFLGFMLSTRRFSRLDSILKAFGTSAPKLGKALTKSMTPETFSNIKAGSQTLATPLDHPLLEQARHLASNTSACSKKQKVQAEHLLKAFTQSQDPLIRPVLKHAGITENAIDGALSQLSKPKWLGLTGWHYRSALFAGKEMVEIVVTVIFFLIVVKEGLGELRLIPSESMVPTLQIGDRLVVEKVTRWFRPTQRKDILVFYPPRPDAVLHHDLWSTFLRITGFSSWLHNAANDPVDKAYIKRVIGLPGETVQIVPVGGLIEENEALLPGVYINGERLTEPYINEKSLHCGPENYFCLPHEIPQGYYFMMGDNRNRSRDSRFFGFVPKGRHVGRAVFRILPLERIGTL